MADKVDHIELVITRIADGTLTYRVTDECPQKIKALIEQTIAKGIREHGLTLSEAIGYLIGVLDGLEQGQISVTVALQKAGRN